jgi:hypothetical protein
VINKPHHLLIKIRATLGVLAILMGSLTAPAVLALQAEENVCAMACCITEGHCCCKVKKAFVKGQNHDGKVSLTKAEMAKPCPENCANSSSTVKPISRDALRENITHFILFATIVTASQPPPTTKEIIGFTALSPRAPPANLSFIA